MDTIDHPAASASPTNPDGIDTSELAGLLGYTVRRAQIAIYEDFARVLGPLELRPAEFSALALIDRNPGLRQRELGGALGIRPPNIVGMLNRLEARSLIERRPHPLDSRSFALSLTADGAVLLRRARTLVKRHDRSVAGALSDADYHRLIEMLRKIPN
jgi:DNA-binding MarR family transcriptional regulator